MRVGSGFAGFNASVPLAELYASDAELRLSGPFEWELVFPRKAVTALSKHRGLFSVGVRIRHAIPEYDELVVFWTFRYKAVKKYLQELGYPFED
jgi:hypothetical protein